MKALKQIAILTGLILGFASQIVGCSKGDNGGGGGTAAGPAVYYYQYGNQCFGTDNRTVPVNQSLCVNGYILRGNQCSQYTNGREVQVDGLYCGLNTTQTQGAYRYNNYGVCVDANNLSVDPTLCQYNNNQFPNGNTQQQQPCYRWSLINGVYKCY